MPLPFHGKKWSENCFYIFTGDPTAVILYLNENLLINPAGFNPDMSIAINCFSGVGYEIFNDHEQHLKVRIYPGYFGI